MNITTQFLGEASARLTTDAPLEILLIGGTGFVGSQLVPSLLKRGHNVSVTSRTPDPARYIFDSENWADATDSADVVVLLSVINNDLELSMENVRAVNVDLPLKLLDIVSKNPGQRLILFGSDLADGDRSSMYTKTKSELAAKLRLHATSAVTMLTLSPVHGDRFVKKLAFVDYLPSRLRSIVVSAIGAVRPLTHIERITDAIENSAFNTASMPTFITVVDDQSQNFFYSVVTRILDLCFASAVFILSGWLMIMIASLIAVTSPGPALFRQQRIGRHGHVFVCFKFRTMNINTPNVATHNVSADATTKIGGYLRACKLDELPQIFNIFANQMSLVGPRPCLPSQHDLITARQRLAVLGAKPGVTGWSQIHSVDMSDPTKLARMDADYCSRRSIPLYLKIILLTFLGKGQGDRIRHVSVP